MGRSVSSVSCGSLAGGGTFALSAEIRPGSMLGFGVAADVGAGDSETGCFGEQARQTTSTAAIKRSGGMRLLTEGRRVERREDERAEVRPGIVGGDAKGKGELLASF